MIKITIQTQCPLSSLTLITRGVSITRLAQGATITMSMTDIIVGMIMTAGTQDPGTAGAEITGTTMTMSPGGEVIQGPETTGSIVGMITSTNLDVEESKEVMITMTIPHILQTLVNAFQILIFV